MSQSGGETSAPRAMIHRRILDIAESDPSASMEGIADQIAGASTELVGRVLEQYGDPAGDETETGGSHDTAEQERRNGSGGPETVTDTVERDTGTDDGSRNGGAGRGDGGHEELSEKQMRVLRLIEERPDASQSDLAGEFDVTRPTVSRWLNDIPGFSWGRRREFASAILNGGEIPTTADRGGPERAEELECLRQEIDALERRLDRTSPEERGDRDGPDIGPELAHKVVHASMKSDLMTEAEELRLLRALMD